MFVPPGKKCLQAEDGDSACAHQSCFLARKHRELLSSLGFLFFSMAFSDFFGFEVIKPAGDWSIAMSAGSMSALDHAIGMFLNPGESRPGKGLSWFIHLTSL